MTHPQGLERKNHQLSELTFFKQLLAQTLEYYTIKKTKYIHEIKKRKKISTRKSNFPYKRNGLRLVVLEVPGVGTLDDPEPTTTTLLSDGAKEEAKWADISTANFCEEEEVLRQTLN